MACWRAEWKCVQRLLPETVEAMVVRTKARRASAVSRVVVWCWAGPHKLPIGPRHKVHVFPFGLLLPATRGIIPSLTSFLFGSIIRWLACLLLDDFLEAAAPFSPGSMLANGKPER